MNKSKNQIKQYETLESFPAWQESRKLLCIVRDMQAKRVNEKDQTFWPTITSKVEYIFFSAAEAFERCAYDRHAQIPANLFIELAKLKTTFYILYERGKLSSEELAGIILQAAKVKREFLKVRAAQKKPLYAHAAAPTLPAGYIPACNIDLKNNKKKPEKDS